MYASYAIIFCLCMEDLQCLTNIVRMMIESNWSQYRNPHNLYIKRQYRKGHEIRLKEIPDTPNVFGFQNFHNECSVPGEGYTRKPSGALNYISTFLLESPVRYLCLWTISPSRIPSTQLRYWHLFCVWNVQFLK
jgi:hypothetical protein